MPRLRDSLELLGRASVVSRIHTGIGLVAGYFVLAGALHDPSIDEPWGWVAAFGLAAAVFVAGALALMLASMLVLALLVYLPNRISRVPGRSFRVASDGGLVIAVFGYRSTWGKLLSLGSADTSVIGTGHFSLVVDDRGLSFQRTGQQTGEIAFVDWSRVKSVDPAVIVFGRQSSNGIAVTVAGPERGLSIEFTCARLGMMANYGRQPWDELQELCDRILAKGIEANHPR